MSMIARLLGKRKIVAPVVPDDSELKQQLNAAKIENAEAVSKFVSATTKQVSDAELARRVISQLLDRADRVRTIYHANSEK